ncbi:MAG: hypothetical protein E7557_06230 [Ruminococcaceae bacterium]|nr:hypothetical protein [Oscillospiraceae bacterium]
MKRFLCSILSVLFVIGIFFSVPVNVNALNIPEKEIVESDLISPELHNASSAASILSQYIDLNGFNEILLEAQQYSWEINDPKIVFTLDSSTKIPYNSQVFSALKTYISEESGVVGVKVSSVRSLNSYITHIYVEYLSQAECEKLIKEQKLLEIETNKLLAGIKGNSSLSDVEKALLIHDRLALSCSYGYPADKNYSAHTAYSAIVLKKAVCQGYANAYQYLLGLVGIKSEYVSSKYLDHGWNIVYINNIPYHVDVTWDDASGYTEEGKVYHKNFLRSTQGMIETGHADRNGKIDYTSTPTNTTYDNYFWQNSSTGFQLLNNEIYYFDNLNEKLMKLNKTDGSDATLVKTVSCDWMFEEQGTGINSFTKLATDGAFLYYSTPTQIFKLNPVTKEETVEYTLKTPDEYVGKNNVDCSLWGLSYIDCTFTYEYIIFEFGALDSKSTNKKVVKTNHTQSNWITDKEPNCSNTGSKHIECTVCKNVLKTESIPTNGKHIAGNWETTKNATATAVGTKVKKCTICKTVMESASVPKIPGIPTATIKNSASGITINWSATANAKSYIVYRRTYNTSTKKYSGWTALKSGYTGTSYTDKTVKLGTTYSYTVRAVNGESKSNYKGTSNLVYNVTPTVKVANASNGIKVSWSTAANATGYTVYSSTYNTKTKKWSGWANRGTAKATATSWVDKNAKSGTQYRYTVRARNNSFASAYNKNGVATLFLAQPTVKIANNASGMKVSWNKIAGSKGYTIYRSEYVNGAWSGWKNMGTIKNGSTVSWVDKSASSGKTYRYTVRAINGSVKSTYTASNTLLYLAQPKTTVKAVSNGINVSWTQSAGSTGYTIYRMEYNAKTKKWSGWKKMGTAAASKKTWTDKSAKKGVTYRYTVKAVNGKVASTYKASANVKR